MNDQIQQQPIPQPETQQPSSAGRNSEKKASGSWIPAIAVTALLMSFLLLYRIESGTSSADGVYVVDGLRLTRSYQKNTANDRNSGLKSPEQINNEAYTMEQKINAEIATMAAAGKVIIQKQSVWAYPPESDITEEIAASVGIRLVDESSAGGDGLPLQRNDTPQTPVPGHLPDDAALKAGGAELD